MASDAADPAERGWAARAPLSAFTGEVRKRFGAAGLARFDRVIVKDGAPDLSRSSMLRCSQR